MASNFSVIILKLKHFFQIFPPEIHNKLAKKIFLKKWTGKMIKSYLMLLGDSEKSLLHISKKWKETALSKTNEFSCKESIKY